jgi:hypothetical protein
MINNNSYFVAAGTAWQCPRYPHWATSPFAPLWSVARAAVLPYKLPLSPRRDRALNPASPCPLACHASALPAELWPPRPSARLGRRGAKTLNTVC